MGKDKRGVKRGRCLSCQCDEYEAQEGLLCEYCGHPPAKHFCEEPLEQAPRMVPRDNNDEQGKGDSADMKQKDKPCSDCSVGIDDDSAVGEEFGPPSKEQSNEPHSSVVSVDDEVEILEDLGSYTQEKEAASKRMNESNGVALELQKKIDAVVCKEGIGCENVGLKFKRNKPFAFCSVCKIEIALRNARQGPYFVGQHLGTQLHKTNAMIAHARDSNIPADLAKIKAQIDEKFPDVFIHKTRSVVCRGCTKEISLIGNLFGNLSQHVGTATHKQNMSRQ